MPAAAAALDQVQHVNLSPEQEREDLQRMVTALGAILVKCAKKEDLIRWAEQLLSRPKEERNAAVGVVALEALAAFGVTDRRFAALRG